MISSKWFLYLLGGGLFIWIYYRAVRDMGRRSRIKDADGSPPIDSSDIPSNIPSTSEVGRRDCADTTSNSHADSNPISYGCADSGGGSDFSGCD